MRSVTFWQNMPSIHQAPLMRALADEVAARGGGGVHVVAVRDVGEERRSQGWAMPDFGRAELTISADARTRAALLQARRDRRDVHVFSGIHAERAIWRDLRQAAVAPALVGIFAEAGRHDEPLRARLRKAIYGFHARTIGPRIDLLLAAGSMGVAFYAACGFGERILHPFGYFTEPPAQPQEDSPGPAFRFLVVGQLVARKGLDVVLESLARLAGTFWRLEIVGSGIEEPGLRTQAARLGIAERIDWRGNLPNTDVRDAMAQADCLILPSRYDGWGAVVNEALQAGTPVVCSDACGARDLVGEPWRGAVFPAGDVERLAAALHLRLREGPPDAAQRRRIVAWSDRAISPVVAARYLCDVLEHARAGARASSRPVAPWISPAISS